MFVGQYPKYILDICSCYSIIDMGNGCNLDEQSNCVPAVVNSVSINDNQTILLTSENRFIKGSHPTPRIALSVGWFVRPEQNLPHHRYMHHTYMHASGSGTRIIDISASYICA